MLGGGIAAGAAHRRVGEEAALGGVAEPCGMRESLHSACSVAAVVDSRSVEAGAAAGAGVAESAWDCFRASAAAADGVVDHGSKPSPGAATWLLTSATWAEQSGWLQQVRSAGSEDLGRCTKTKRRSAALND